MERQYSLVPVGWANCHPFPFSPACANPLEECLRKPFCLSPISPNPRGVQPFLRSRDLEGANGCVTTCPASTATTLKPKAARTCMTGQGGERQTPAHVQWGSHIPEGQRHQHPLPRVSSLTLILTSFGASFFTSLSNLSPKPVDTKMAKPGWTTANLLAMVAFRPLAAAVPLPAPWLLGGYSV